MDQKQPLEVIGNDLVSIQMIPGQKEQKLSKKAKNSQLAITLSSSSEMNSFFVTNDNFFMQKQWPVQKNKLNFFAQKKLDFLVPLLLKIYLCHMHRAIGFGNNTPHFSSSGEFRKLHTDRLHCETQ